MFRRATDGVYRSSLLDQEPWLEHGFGTRHSDDWPGEYARVRQIHSAIVVTADNPAELAKSPQADGIASATPGLWVGIRTADCVPLLLADPRHRTVASIHAGWRGTAANIAAEGVRQMHQVWGSEPHTMIAAIGPAIGRCCFEVGPEVALDFEMLFPEAAHPQRYLDLIEANRRQLIAAGLKPGRIDVLDVCTRCGDQEFHSWRRDREESGRMVAAIRLQPQL